MLKENEERRQKTKLEKMKEVCPTPHTSLTLQMRLPSSGQVLTRKAKKKRKTRIIVFLPSTVAETFVTTLPNRVMVKKSAYSYPPIMKKTIPPTLPVMKMVAPLAPLTTKNGSLTKGSLGNYLLRLSKDLFDVEFYDLRFHNSRSILSRIAILTTLLEIT
ncbi:hypothetical protein CRG98_017222 [Punica granatum]|uniref:Uncharacterized protein n=1 Tax=Punica granatum TaxID=22663 RepID=A0A2I0K3Y1_PUNGR|nr:hypothetical protein CRG98_017222 [Punica granatum]